MALLGAYDWAAFGSPFHLSYQYVTDPAFSVHQSAGLFGIHLPTLHGTYLVLAGNRGLLWDSPVLVAAGFGLVLLWRRGWRAEALVCAFVSLRVPRAQRRLLPPLRRRLARAHGSSSRCCRSSRSAWRRRSHGGRCVTGVLALLSVTASTAIALTWPAAASSGYGYRWNVWRELAVLVHSGPDAPLARWAQKSVFTWAGIGPLGSEAIIAAFAAAAFALAFWVGWSARDQAGLRP